MIFLGPPRIAIGLVLWAFAASPAVAADPAPSLAESLQGEGVANLAKSAREAGDAARGAVLFFQPFLQCSRCHDGPSGDSLGPDLARPGPEATAESRIEAVLMPSKVIRKGYETVVIALKDGRTFSGRSIEEKDGRITLLDPSAGGRRVVFAADEIETRATAERSAMPDGLANLLSDRQQFLDLAKYLIEIAEHGPTREAELRPSRALPTIAEYEATIDHARLIGSLDDSALRRGEAIFTRVAPTATGRRPGRARCPAP